MIELQEAGTCAWGLLLAGAGAGGGGHGFAHASHRSRRERNGTGGAVVPLCSSTTSITSSDFSRGLQNRKETGRRTSVWARALFFPNILAIRNFATNIFDMGK